MLLCRIALIFLALLLRSDAFQGKSGPLHRSALSTKPWANLRPRGTLRMGADQAGIVTMYHKTTCPFCVKATELLKNEYGVDIKVDYSVLY